MGLKYQESNSGGSGCHVTVVPGIQDRARAGMEFEDDMSILPHCYGKTTGIVSI